LPVLPKHDRPAVIAAYDVKRVLADIDTDHGDSRIELVWHGVLLVFGAPSQHPLLAGPEHGRTIPLAVLRPLSTDDRLQMHTLGLSYQGVINRTEFHTRRRAHGHFGPQLLAAQSVRWRRSVREGLSSSRTPQIPRARTRGDSDSRHPQNCAADAGSRAAL